MNEDLSLSDAGARLIQVFESCGKKIAEGLYEPYVCPGGELTIGWGHTNAHAPHFSATERWTQEKCDEVFRSDMRIVEDAVKRLVKVRLGQNQFDALVSFVYNVGEGNFAKSTLLRRINAGDFEAAALEFPKWNKSKGRVLPGLERRRAAEALMFRGIPDPQDQVRRLGHDGAPDDMPRRVDASVAD